MSEGRNVSGECGVGIVVKGVLCGKCSDGSVVWKV